MAICDEHSFKKSTLFDSSAKCICKIIIEYFFLLKKKLSMTFVWDFV